MHVEKLTLGPFQSNCYIIPVGEEAVVIDPGSEAPRIAAALATHDLEVAAILLTHAHLDHIAGVGSLRARHDAPIYLHPADRALYDHAEEQAAAFGLSADPLPSPDHQLRHGDRLEFGALGLDVRHAPGHSPGGVVFVAEGCAFVGDCVFEGSIGRTDLPGGDTAALLRSIREQILTLPDDTVLYTGHGGDTTVGVEAIHNPFLTGQFG